MSFTVEKLQQDLQALHHNKEQALQTFHQILGAISIVEQMIGRLLTPDEAPVEPPVPQEPSEGANEHGEVEHQAAEQTA